jgi:cytochrome c oxidase subunit 4
VVGSDGEEWALREVVGAHDRLWVPGRNPRFGIVSPTVGCLAERAVRSRPRKAPEGDERLRRFSRRSACGRSSANSASRTQNGRKPAQREESSRPAEPAREAEAPAVRRDPESRFLVRRCETEGDAERSLMEHVVVPRSTYFAVYIALVVLTVLTTTVAFFDLGLANPIVALSIAVLKATLIVLFFMHLKYGSRLTWVVAGASVFWLGILLLLILSDYATRVPVRV